MTKVILRGCNGRMGQVITEIAENDAGIEIVAGIDLVDQGKNPYPVFGHLIDCDVPADVLQ